jgi:Sulfatase
MTHKLRSLLQAAGVALGVTSIYLLWLIGPLVTPAHDAIFHWSEPPFQLFVPPILDFCAFWLLLTVVLLLVKGRLRVAIWCGMIALTPWMELKNWAYLTETDPAHLLSVGLFGIAAVAFLLPLLLWRSAYEERFEQVVKFASTLFLFSAISGVVILCEFAWFGWQARSLNAELPLHQAANRQPAEAGRPRVIWILFDELSYEQVYERRFPGLQLPSFDALAAQATVFTHVIPAGTLTAEVLPSLMNGAPVDSARASSDGKRLSLHNSHTRAWQRFDEHDTVFQDALNLNYSAAVAGWYNPYCRILPDVLDRCYWTFGSSAENAMVPRATLGTNLMRPWMRFFRSGLGHRFATLVLRRSEGNELRAKQHIFDYEAVADAADGMLKDDSIDFVFIHIPIPHPGGIYDRTTDEFVLRHSSYIDNLALTDKLLGHIRSELEQRGEWDASTIIVMADHSWRTKMFWEGLPDWTKEEQIASRGGEFDDRPAYLVKLPEQRTGTRIDAPFAALNTRNLLDALLSQKIRSKEDLAAWAKQTTIDP